MFAFGSYSFHTPWRYRGYRIFGNVFLAIDRRRYDTVNSLFRCRRAGMATSFAMGCPRLITPQTDRARSRFKALTALTGKTRVSPPFGKPARRAIPLPRFHLEPAAFPPVPQCGVSKTNPKRKELNNGT